MGKWNIFLAKKKIQYQKINLCLPLKYLDFLLTFIVFMVCLITLKKLPKFRNLTILLFWSICQMLDVFVQWICYFPRFRKILVESEKVTLSSNEPFSSISEVFLLKVKKSYKLETKIKTFVFATIHFLISVSLLQHL